MTLASGRYRLRPESGGLVIRTGRTGMGRRAGHDLVLEVTRWEGEITVDAAEPSRSAVAVDADVDSLEVREGTGGVKPLSGNDRAEIKKTLKGILDSQRFPRITFRSTGVAGPAESLAVEGDLSIRGATRPVTMRASVEGNRVRGSSTVTQTQWGIKPYSAFLGALRLADDVAVEFEATLEPSSE